MNRNIFFKYLLRDLGNMLPKDKHVKALRKAYMDAKSVDAKTPLLVFLEHGEAFAEHIRNKDLDYFVDIAETLPDIVAPMPAILKTLSPEDQDIVWEHLQIILDGPPQDEEKLEEKIDMQAIQNVISQNAPPFDATMMLNQDDPDQIGKMIEATTKMMPQIFQQLGMQVSKDEIDTAAKQIQDKGLLKLFSTMMK